VSWEVTLFHWAGWFSLTLLLAAAGTAGVWALWQVYQGFEKAARANAALFAAYLKYAYKHRFKDADAEDISSMTLDGVKITVEVLEDDE